MSGKTTKNLCLKSSRQLPFYYKRVLDELEKSDLKLAADMKDLDQEIIFLRTKIKSLSFNDPANFQNVAQAINALARLIVIRQKIHQESRIGLKEAVVGIMKDIAVPFGIAALNKKL